MNENIKKIAEHYGYGEQSLMLIEEIADVEIVLDQIKWLLGCEANVKMWKDIKVARQVKRIEAEDDRQKAERMANRIRELVKE